MFKRYSHIKTLTKNFNILSNADANANANADAGVIAIALPVLSYRRANKTTLMETRIYNLLIIMKMGHALDLKVTLTKELRVT